MFDDDMLDDFVDDELFLEGDSLFFNRDDIKEDDEDLKDFWNLNDNEIKEVKKGNYDPWNFEEEDLEEDDFYFEDE